MSKSRRSPRHPEGQRWNCYRIAKAMKWRPRGTLTLLRGDGWVLMNMLRFDWGWRGWNEVLDRSVITWTNGAPYGWLLFRTDFNLDASVKRQKWNLLHRAFLISHIQARFLSFVQLIKLNGMMKAIEAHVVSLTLPLILWYHNSWRKTHLDHRTIHQLAQGVIHCGILLIGYANCLEILHTTALPSFSKRCHRDEYEWLCKSSLEFPEKTLRHPESVTLNAILLGFGIVVVVHFRACFLVLTFDVEAFFLRRAVQDRLNSFVSTIQQAWRGQTHLVASNFCSNEIQGLKKLNSKSLALSFLLDGNIFNVTLSSKQVQARKQQSAKMIWSSNEGRTISSPPSRYLSQQVCRLHLR